MIKVFAFIAKRRDISEQQFHAHWREPHGRLTQAVGQIQRYIQNHAIGGAGELSGLAAMRYQGIATIWVEEPATLDEIFANPAFLPVKQDEANFLEQEHLAWLICDSHVHGQTADPANISAVPGKIMLFLRRSQYLSGVEFAQRLQGAAQWGKRTLPGIAQVSVDLPRADVYDDANPSLFDGVLELSVGDRESAEQAWCTQGAACLGQLQDLVRMDASRGFLAQEERFIWPPFAA